MRPVNCVLENGAGSDLIPKNAPGEQLAKSVKHNSSGNLKGASSQRVFVALNIMLHVRVGNCRVLVIFGKLKSSGVSFFLRTSVIERFVKGILSSERRIVMYSSDVGLILLKIKEDD